MKNITLLLCNSYQDITEHQVVQPVKAYVTMSRQKTLHFNAVAVRNVRTTHKNSFTSRFRKPNQGDSYSNNRGDILFHEQPFLRSIFRRSLPGPADANAPERWEHFKNAVYNTVLSTFGKKTKKIAS